MNYVIDRYEGEYAILLDTNSRQFDVLIDDLPKNSQVGDIFHFDEGIFISNEEFTQEQREKFKDINSRIVTKY